MSSFLFLTFCVYVFRCLGLHFSEFILLGLSSGGFYLCRTNLHRGLTRLQQGRSGASVVSLPYLALKTAHERPQGRVCFSLQNELTPPPKGGGAGYHLTWLAGILMQRSPVLFRRKNGYFVSEGFSRQLPVATAAHNCPTRLQQGLFGASVVSFPYPALKTSHRAEFDFTVVFWCAFALAVTPSLAPACN